VTPDIAIAWVAGWLDNVHVESAEARIAETQAINASREMHREAVQVTEAELVRCSIHEAAHAVVAHGGGLQVDRVCIREDASGCAGYRAADDSIESLIGTIAADLAGLLVELLADIGEQRQFHLARSHDVLAARLDIERVRADGGDWNLPTRTFVVIAMSAVLNHWRAIHRAAYVLRATGELYGAEISVLTGRLQ
jgi:hypothetical protein